MRWRSCFWGEGVRDRGFLRLGIGAEKFPQWLKPHCKETAYGATKAAPFQNKNRLDWLYLRRPRVRVVRWKLVRAMVAKAWTMARSSVER